MRSKELFFIIAHPVQSLKIKSRQIAVSIEHQQPPCTSTFEEFPELPIYEAAAAIKEAESAKKIISS